MPPPSTEPFAWGDFTWLNGNDRRHSRAFDSQYFTPQLDVDANYTYSFWHPNDNTVVGSSLMGRNNEVELSFLGVGGDFDITPQHRVSGNLNQLWFDNTATLEAARQQANIGRSIGTDASVAWIYRPFFTQNVVVRLSGAVLRPGSGFKALYGTDHSTYYSVLANVILTY